MGREWYLNWGTKSSSKKGRTTSGGGGDGGGGGRNGGGSQKRERKSSTPPTTTAAAAAAAAATAGGCMNAVLHMFDFQHFQLCLHPQDNSFFPDDPTPLKGLEAPRNSLESITEQEKDDHLHILKSIQIKTNRRDTKLKLLQVPRGKIEDSSSESSYSPAGARTPSLVARLMGLEILPESNNTTPRSSSHSQISPHIRPSTPPSTTTSKTKKTSSRPKNPYYENGPGPRSTPETPRSSSTSTRRRSTDVVDHHRLSLQINKENSIVKEMELSRPSCSAISTKRKEGKNYEEEVTKSPSYYARQIMKQVRGSVSRRVGVDITNTIAATGGRSSEHRRDEHLLSSTHNTTTTKPKKSKKDQLSSSLLSSSSSHHLSSSSPKFKTCDENKKVMSSKSEQLTATVAETSPKTIAVQTKSIGSENESLKKVTSNGSKLNLMSKKPLKPYDSIRNKKDEQFVRPSTSKKCKKTTMFSSDFIRSSSPQLTIKLLEKQGVSSNAQPSKPIITNTSTSTSATATRLSRYPRQRIYEKNQEEATRASAERLKIKNDNNATVISAMEFQYISRILKCTGIDRDTPVSFMRWYLPSHPLDPSIYHNLEATHYYLTTNDSSFLAINRKLIFHLVDEMLADILKPYVKLKPHYHRNRVDKQNHQINGFQLVKILCTKIRSFPSADCQTLQDIDALVEKELHRFGATNNLISYQDEGEEIISKIEREILESLVQEIWFA